MTGRKKNIYLAVSVLFIGLLIMVGTFSYWTWVSSENKNIVFNTAKGLADYIIYDSGESKFVGDFKVGDSYTEGVHTTVSIYKKEEASKAMLYATIYMKVNSIGNNLSNTKGLKWVITEGDSTNTGNVLAEGNFIGAKAKDEFIILPSIEVTTSKKEYTVWIWLDSKYATSDMGGETLDTIVWTQVDQVIEDSFEITRLSNNYQIINATVVNATKNIVSYAITNSNVEPSDWVNITDEEQSRIYTLEYAVSSAGTYYVWFKDTAGKIINKSIEISEVNNNKPSCTFSEFDPVTINNGDTSKITLTCMDSTGLIGTGDITKDNLVLSNEVIDISKIEKENIDNGYKYIITVTAKSNTGNVTIKLNNNILINSIGNGNDAVTSNKLGITSTFSITYKDVENTEFSGIHEEEYPQTYESGIITPLDIPSKKGYTFNGYYLSSDGSGDRIAKISEDQTGNITLYAKWIDDPPYGVANLSLNDGVFTLSLSNYGDDGSGLTDTFGFALISTGTCETATYENITATSKTYSDNFIENTTYYGCIKLTDNSGNIAYLTSIGLTYTKAKIYTTHGEYTITVPATGIYKIELWGAQGGGTNGGNGAYTAGTINFNKNEILKFYVGGSGDSNGIGGYNGGGNAGVLAVNNDGGGGSTDVRYIETTTNSRIMVAAGGGGANANGSNTAGIGKTGGAGGGLSGYAGTSVISKMFGNGGTQISGGAKGQTSRIPGTDGSFFAGGVGGISKVTPTTSGGAGGGSGYYGGGSGEACQKNCGGSGGGGSSYISGHTGCVAITSSDSITPKTGCTTGTSNNLCSIHYSGKSFTNTVMIDGSGYAWTNSKGSLQQMPNPSDGYFTSGSGKTGDGAARITFISTTTIKLIYDNNGGDGCNAKSIVTGSKYGELCTPTRDGYKFVGWYTESSDGNEITENDEITVTEEQTIYAHWEELTKPMITFTPNGNDSYKNGTINTIINVFKGSASLDLSSLKYIYSTDINATPNIYFIRGEEVKLENSTGIYYLIASACDISGNCTKEISNPFYVDNILPIGMMTLSFESGYINVNVDAVDNDSGIKEYGYLIQKDNTTCPTSGYTSSTNNNYFLAAYEEGNYTACVKVIDKAGNAGYISNNINLDIRSITYKDVGNVEFSGAHEDDYPLAYNVGETTTLDSPTKIGYTFYGYYLNSDGSGNQITEISSTENSNITLYAKWVDDVAPYGIANLSLIDGIFTLSLFNYGDDGVGLTDTFGFTLISTGTCETATYENTTATSKTYSDNLTNGTIYYGCIKLSDKNNNVAYLKSSEIAYIYASGSESYTTSGEHTFTAPATGDYKLEVWGAEGGAREGTAGFGGYSLGTVELSINEKLYINVGGQGGSASGGYNGGGNRTEKDTYSWVCGSGGGATHISKVTGLLSTLSNQKDQILIVAGGGGGYCGNGTVSYAGGSGGGYIGNSSEVTTGGSQTEGGSNANETTEASFGKGADSTNEGAGGGGYYGGGSGKHDTIGYGGAGGSGYIGNSLLTDKYMYCYSCTTSSAQNTKTYSTSKVSITPTANYAKKGDGAAKITYKVINNITSLILTYNNNGGTGCYAKTITNGSKYGELCTPVKNGYKFVGWYTESSGGNKVTENDEVTVTENQTIYAHWEESTLPIINISPNGNSGYVKGNITSKITVTKGDNRLNKSSFKYIYSTDINVEPDNSFISGNSYTLENASGIYYLIASACDIAGNCVKEISNPFYVDNIIPTGELSLSKNGGMVIATVSSTVGGSGIKEYGYLLQTSDSCPTSGYTSSQNDTYNFAISAKGTYYVCVKITNNVDNSVIISGEIVIENISYTYQQVSTSYSCANKSVGSSYIFTYTGNCEVVANGDDGWKIRYLSSGNLTLPSEFSVDLFLVGGGGGGSGSAGGGGGYTATYLDQVIATGTYTVQVGAQVSSGGSGNKSYFGDASKYVANGGNAGGNGSGGSGGSGGGGRGGTCCVSYDGNQGVCNAASEAAGGAGGSFGSNGYGGSGCSMPWGTGAGAGGSGQGNTTCEFGLGTTSGCMTGVSAYSAGGHGKSGTSVSANSGNGGGRSSAGSSGIVIMRSTSITDVTINDEVIGTYNGEVKVVESDGNYKITFYTSGSLILKKALNVDLFLVGGGGGGNSGGGGGGYTKTYTNETIEAGTYEIKIGNGGNTSSNGGTTYFGTVETYFANGGNGSTGYSGANGGSGGGGRGGVCCVSYDANQGVCNASSEAGGGAGGAYGTNGSAGGSCSMPWGAGAGSGGSGQGTTTCEFGEGTTASCNNGVTSYAKGGPGYVSSGAMNTGNGGGRNSAGGSGILIIRNTR